MFADFVPCISIVSVLLVIFGFLAFLRYMNYKETISLAERGLPPPERKPVNRLLRWGILLSILGLILTAALYPIGFTTGDGYPLHLGPWMLGGFVPLFLGLSLIIAHFLFQKE